jgi:hypothetical protein
LSVLEIEDILNGISDINNATLTSTTATINVVIETDFSAGVIMSMMEDAIESSDVFEVIESFESLSFTTMVTTTLQSYTESSASTSTLGSEFNPLLIGVAVGISALVVIAILIVVVFFFKKKRDKNKVLNHSTTNKQADFNNLMKERSSIKKKDSVLSKIQGKKVKNRTLVHPTPDDSSDYNSSHLATVQRKQRARVNQVVNKMHLLSKFQAQRDKYNRDSDSNIVHNTGTSAAVTAAVEIAVRVKEDACNAKILKEDNFEVSRIFSSGSSMPNKNIEVRSPMQAHHHHRPDHRYQSEPRIRRKVGSRRKRHKNKQCGQTIPTALVNV